MESGMEISYNSIGDKRIMKVKGQVGMNNLAEFKKAMDDMTDGTYKSVIVDLKDVPFLDSSVLSVLMAGKKKIEKHRCSFGLVNVSDNLMQILVMCSLDRFFTFYENYESFMPK